MKILFFGDIVGKIGRKAINKVLPELKKELRPDLVLANGENLAHGKGVTEKTIKEVVEAGIDFLTSGNHIWAEKKVIPILEEGKLPLIRPANYPPGTPGAGEKIIEVGGMKVLIINLMGRVFIKEDLDCPFRKIDKILEEYKKEKLTAIIVDLHAEATSEKQAFGWHVDGRVSAVVGTHTHIGTSDGQILPQGTAYITDIGMVGAKKSVIGVDKSIIQKIFLTQMPTLHEIPEEGICTFNAVLVEIDPKTKKATKIERIDREVNI
jgi:metallophosphoesterase (TIGR00282 family)